MNVVRRCREYVNVSITQKTPKLRHLHTPEGPYPRYEKASRAIREKIGQNSRVRLNGLAMVKKCE